jgi:hypothetical protein
MIPLKILLYLFSASAYAFSGKIAFLEGDVQIGKNGHFDRAKVGQTVNEGEAVKTGEHALAIVMTADGSQLKLKQNSEITLSSSNKSEVLLNSGGVFTSVLKREKKHFSIRTKSAVMGVRGTRFFTSYGDAGKHEGDLWMCVDEGLVSVEVPGESDAVLVKEGLGIFVPKGRKITEPKPYAWTKDLNWNMDPKQGEVSDHTEIEASYKNLLKQNYD